MHNEPKAYHANLGINVNDNQLENSVSESYRQDAFAVFQVKADVKKIK